jgi:hypothetical protein
VKNFSLAVLFGSDGISNTTSTQLNMCMYIFSSQDREAGRAKEIKKKKVVEQ